MYVSCFLNRTDLEVVDVVGLYKTLKALGYQCFVGNGLLVQAYVGRFESREHIHKELLMDVESLLKRFKIKK